MELNITQFFQNAAHRDYSASCAELGQDAGRITWRHAVEDAPDYPMLDSDEKREAFREHVRAFGAWSDEEISAWSDEELTALLLQLVAGDIREAGINTSAPDWEEYRQGVENGTYSGSIYPGDEGAVYYCIGA